MNNRTTELLAKQNAFTFGNNANTHAKLFVFAIKTLKYCGVKDQKYTDTHAGLFHLRFRLLASMMWRQIH